jgi:hypothetical protein
VDALARGSEAATKISKLETRDSASTATASTATSRGRVHVGMGLVTEVRNISKHATCTRSRWVP